MWARLGGISLLLSLVLACGSEPDDQLLGTYVLVGVEGHALPYLTSDANCDVSISEGDLVLHEGGTYDLQFSGPFDCSRSGGPSGDSIGRVYTGTYTQSGSALQFNMQIQGGGSLQFSGTINPLESFVTVPPIPPATGPNLRLQLAKTQ
jgi:hypothetical protein